MTDVYSQLSNAGRTYQEAALVLTVPISFALVVESKRIDRSSTVRGFEDHCWVDAKFFAYPINP